LDGLGKLIQSQTARGVMAPRLRSKKDVPNDGGESKVVRR